MPGEGSFDAKPAIITTQVDFDAPDFRNASVARVHTALGEQLSGLRGAFQGRSPEQIRDFITRSAESIDRSVLGVNDQEDISSTPDTAIVHAFGMPIWNKPTDTARLESEMLTDLATRFSSGEMDTERFAQGVYFLQVLLHKYKNGNGRTARALKLLVEKAGNADGVVNEDDTRGVLGIGREGVTKTSETTYRINFNPDFERLVLGVAYFGLEKGLTSDEVTGKLKLNGALPEQGLDALSQRLGTAKTQLKDDFIRFMTVQSDLGWCDFGQQK
jgi:hypothetical protein